MEPSHALARRAALPTVIRMSDGFPRLSNLTTSFRSKHLFWNLRPGSPATSQALIEERCSQSGPRRGGHKGVPSPRAAAVALSCGRGIVVRSAQPGHALAPTGWCTYGAAKGGSHAASNCDRSYACGTLHGPFV